MKRREDNNFTIVPFYLLIKLVNNTSFLEILISEEEITDKQFLDSLHLNAANDFLFPIGNFILMIFHHVVELLKNS